MIPTTSLRNTVCSIFPYIQTEDNCLCFFFFPREGMGETITAKHLYHSQKHFTALKHIKFLSVNSSPKIPYFTQ
ncbi:MAG: hypothetical protein IKV90_05225 [Clostridia bacterium]|nr:hypothetical protein [Clostridia bacterium]